MGSLTEPRAQVNIIGSIDHLQHFEKCQSYFVKYSIKYGEKWHLLNGKTEGETFEYVLENDSQMHIGHSIDLHFSTESVRGWPKIMLEVWVSDQDGRNKIAGYGMASLPIVPWKKTSVSAACWAPRPGLVERMLGSHPELAHKDILMASQPRVGLVGQSCGFVSMSFTCFSKDFDIHGVLMGTTNVDIDDK